LYYYAQQGARYTAFLRGDKEDGNRRPEEDTIAAMRADGGGDGYQL
jgi:hypothetical protein